MGNIGQANYAASKSGMFGLTTTLAREAAQTLAKEDKLHDNGLGRDRELRGARVHRDRHDQRPARRRSSRRVKKQIPLGRMGRPEEIARVVHFLCADASSYITGQVFAVNGGMDM